MATLEHTCPIPRQQVIDRYFLEHRAKLLDIAAFLDRLDRAQPDATNAHEDYRIRAMRQAIQTLLEDQPHRARRVHEILSDPTQDPAASAEQKGADGAYNDTA